MVFLTALLAFFTLLLVVVGLLQFRVAAKAAKDSAVAAQQSAAASQQSANAAAETVKVMKRTARRQLRARVFVASAIRIGDPRPGPFVAELTIKNFGGVPAYNCTFRAQMFMRSTLLEGIPPLNKRSNDPSMVLPPGAEVKTRLRLPDGTFADQQQQMVNAGSLAILIHGVIEYRNGFQQDRRSEFLMRCTGVQDYTVGRFAFCEIGNKAD